MPVAAVQPKAGRGILATDEHRCAAGRSAQRLFACAKIESNFICADLCHSVAPLILFFGFDRLDHFDSFDRVCAA
jgi:hypothetical protein